MSAVVFQCKEEKCDHLNFSQGNIFSNEACAKSGLVGRDRRESKSSGLDFLRRILVLEG